MYTHRRKRQKTGRRGIKTLEELCDYLTTEEGKSYLLREDPSGVMPNVKFDCKKIGSGKESMLLIWDIEMAKNAKKGEIGHFDCTYLARIKIKGLYQLLTFMVRLHTQAFAYAWALMPSKAKPYYVTLFGEMKTTLKVTIRKGLVDFEIALQDALKEVFGAVIIGCFFHWCQCLWRYAEGLGIAYPTMSTKDPKKYMVIKQLMALALLPEELIEPTFLAFKDEVKEEFGNHFNGMLDYIQNYWIKIRKPATFCCYDEFIKVNNAIETHHRDLNHIFGHRRPSTWTYFTRMLEFQQMKHIELEQVKQGFDQRPRNAVSDFNEKFLRRAWEDVGKTNGDRLLPLHFLEQAANTLKRFNAPYEKEKLMIQDEDDADSTCSTDDETLSETLEQVDEAILFETYDNENSGVELEQSQRNGTEESHLIQSYAPVVDELIENSSERNSSNSIFGSQGESIEDATAMNYSASEKNELNSSGETSSTHNILLEKGQEGATREISEVDCSTKEKEQGALKTVLPQKNTRHTKKMLEKKNLDAKCIKTQSELP
ncbi:hypothetical protein QAD02_020498 [Eretmocerus hayati]|uniref:Uncharacterized protein n=1 Tax=Eretmocerus hayati TaxID=131215 RepID=A0ACC2PSE8_9HYME|nr:hypothetical protein QAD02_020498 [Eretmocerus hayati]